MRRVMLGLATLAAVGAAVAVPLGYSSSASEAPPAAASATHAPLGASAEGDDEGEVSAKKLTRAYNQPNGHATFESYGEHLFACDDYPDDLYVKAEAKWDNKIQGSVVDTNGFGGGCEEVNLGIEDGKDVNIRACVDTTVGWACGDWVDSEA